MVGQTDNYAKRLYEEEEFVVDEGSNRRKSGHERAPYALGAKDTVYHCLCPERKVGIIIGRGGEIVRQLMASAGARISLPGCEERLVTICSSSNELDASGNTSEYACPAHDALFRVHEKLVGSEAPGDEDFNADSPQVSVRLLASSDQIGQIIGKGGQTIHSIRNDSESLIDIFTNDHIPCCANSSDELVQSFEDLVSSTVDGAVRLQPRCSEMTERGYGQPLYITRLLVPTSHFGCPIGRVRSIINEM